jgi:hypothetical protein
MPINKYTFDNLNNNQIWFTSPLKFNDPFDFFIPYGLNFTDDEFKKIVPLLPGYSEDYYKQMLIYYKENPKELEKWSEIGRTRFVSKTRVACFCEEKTNIPMWSHYADFHKGICLKFDSLYDKHFFHEDDWNYKKLPIKKVNYPKKIKKINYFKDNKDFFINCVYTKYHKWDYEKEHRIISMIDIIQYNKECLVEVNFGCKCKQENKRKIIDIIRLNKYPNVKFIKAIKSRNEFVLEFEEMNV